MTKKNFSFSLIWPIILSLSIFFDQPCHGMKFYDVSLRKHVEISVDDFFTKKPAGSSQTYFEQLAHFAEFRSFSDAQIVSERGIQAFWVPGRSEFSSSLGEGESPFYGLSRFFYELFERRSCFSDLGQKIAKAKLPLAIINNEQERSEFKIRLHRELYNKLQKKDGFDSVKSGELLLKINKLDKTKLPKLVRPMSNCFYSCESRFWIGSSFVLTFGLSLIGCVVHHFRKNADDVTEQEKSDRKKLIICCAALAAIAGGLFAASYWELGSHYDYKCFFNIPPA